MSPRRTRRFEWPPRLAAAVAAVLACPTYARAASFRFSDFDGFCLGYLVLVVPAYLLMLVTSYFWPSPRGGGTATALRIRTCANLLPLATVSAFVVYEYVLKPRLPPGYSDIGFFATWGSIFAPLPLAVLAAHWLPRLPRVHRLASSVWWALVHGAVGGALASRVFR